MFSMCIDRSPKEAVSIFNVSLDYVVDLGASVNSASFGSAPSCCASALSYRPSNSWLAILLMRFPLRRTVRSKQARTSVNCLKNVRNNGLRCIPPLNKTPG